MAQEVQRRLDLSSLNYARLQKYRKSLTDQYSVLRYWDLEDSPKGIFIREEKKRVLAECKYRNILRAKDLARASWCHVPTLKRMANENYR